MSHPRVCMGLVEVSGVMTRLKQGFDEIGVDATLIDLEPSPFAYGPDDTSGLPRVVPLIRRMRRFERSRKRRGLVTRLGVRVAELPLRLVLFIWALRRFDVFIFGYRATFLLLADLPVLKLLRKRTIGVFFGSDERPPYMDAYVAPGLSGAELARRTRLQRRVIAFFGRFADVVVSNPNSAQFWRRPAVVYQRVGNPVALTVSGEPPAVPAEGRGRIVVLHAPSNPRAKGTDRVRQAVKAVQAAGYDIDYREVRNVPNAVLQAAIVDADIVIDQAYGDTPYAMLPAEASLLNRPVLVGGYGWDHLARYLDESFVWPVVCEPDQMEDALRRLVTDRQHRTETAQASHDFMIREWAPAAVAGKYLRLIEGDPPNDWMFDPSSVEFTLGNGVRVEELAGYVRSVVHQTGVAGLGVSDKPVLEDRLVRCAAEADD